MGLEPVSWAFLAFSAYQAYDANQNRQDAKGQAGAARREQEKVQAEQKAQNARNAAEERRKQIREERVRRARIMQSAEMTGTSGSSGESGAVGSLSTQLSSNLGYNAGAFQRGQRISDYNQNASNFMSQSRQSEADAGYNMQLFNLGTNLFMASGGDSLFKPKKPDSNPALTVARENNTGYSTSYGE